MKKANLSFEQKKVWRKVILIILFALLLFSSIMIARRAMDSYKTKHLNNELSKIHEKINAVQTTKTDNSREAEKQSERVIKLNEAIDESISINEEDDINFLEAQKKIIILNKLNEAIAERKRIEAERKRIEEENKVNEIKNQIQQLKKVNRDIKGWIRIDNTQVSNPVVQTVDNSFYLEHDVAKHKNAYGTIFIDVKNDVRNPKRLQGQNIVLYGHHMKDGSMFGSLKKFRDPDFFKANEIINLDIFPEHYKFQIFGIYLVNEDFVYRNARLGNQRNINYFLTRLKKKALQSRDVTLTPNDTILTLSTCEYDFTDARLVVMAKLVSDNNMNGTNQK